MTIKAEKKYRCEWIDENWNFDESVYLNECDRDSKWTLGHIDIGTDIITIYKQGVLSVVLSNIQYTQTSNAIDAIPVSVQRSNVWTIQQMSYINSDVYLWMPYCHMCVLMVATHVHIYIQNMIMII